MVHAAERRDPTSLGSRLVLGLGSSNEVSVSMGPGPWEWALQLRTGFPLSARGMVRSGGDLYTSLALDGSVPERGPPKW